MSRYDDRALTGRNDVSMSQENAFGGAGRSRRIHDTEQVVRRRFWAHVFRLGRVGFPHLQYLGQWQDSSPPLLEDI